MMFHCPAQFFSDVRETEEQLQKLQETLRRKYSCDRSITVTRLEDLLQDAQVRQRQKQAGGQGWADLECGLHWCPGSWGWRTSGGLGGMTWVAVCDELRRWWQVAGWSWCEPYSWNLHRWGPKSVGVTVFVDECWFSGPHDRSRHSL